MNYIVRLTYMDGKDVNVILPEAEIPKFLEKLQKNEPYWAPNNETAFWTSNDQVRFTSIAKEAEVIKAEAETKAKKEEKKEDLKAKK